MPTYQFAIELVNIAARSSLVGCTGAWANSHLGSEDTRDIPGEHRALRDAVLARDMEGAELALAKHIQYTTAALVASAPDNLTAAQASEWSPVPAATIP